MQNNNLCPNTTGEANIAGGAREAGITQKIRLSGQHGLHARPAAQLVRLAQQFKCIITLKTESVCVDAKSILDILSLAAGPGSELFVYAEGADEALALKEVVHFLSEI